MAQFKFEITINADTQEEATQCAQYMQGVLSNNKNPNDFTKLLKKAYEKPSIIKTALTALKIM